MSNYGTWPPTMGHRVIVVDTVAGAVRVTVGRVTGYACMNEDAAGEFRSLSLRLADGSPVPRNGVDEVFDLDAPYSYSTTESAVGVVRDAINAMARALLPPKAAAEFEPPAVPLDEPVAPTPPVEEPF